MTIRHLLLMGLLLALGSSLHITAQEEYNPTLPAEPCQRYKITLSVNQSDAGYISGGGTYQEGKSVCINTSAKSTNYTFAYWKKNGVQYTTERSFNYTVDAAVSFEAVYEFTPSTPLEPTTSYERKLYLTCSPSDACSFNRTSGAKAAEESYVSVKAYLNTGFVFKGWYANGEKVSSNQSFNYLMGNENVTMTAMCEYSPTTPGEPSSSANQGSIQNTALGDLDGNGSLDTSDAVELIGAYIANTTSALDKGVADVDGNGKIDTADAVEIIDKYVNNKK